MPFSAVLADVTAASYAQALDALRAALAPGTRVDDLEFLHDHGAVVAHVEGRITTRGRTAGHAFAPSSLRRTFATLVSLLRRGPPSPAAAAAIAAYAARMAAHAAVVDAAGEAQLLTPREAALHLPWPTLAALPAALLAAHDARPSLSAFQDYLIVSLYTLQPPARLDYSPMRFLDGHLPPEDERCDTNYCVTSTELSTFVLNAYKTSAAYGRRCWTAPARLHAALRAWRDTYNTSGWLLVSPRDGITPLSSPRLGQLLAAATASVTGVPAGATAYRHSYITHARTGELPLAAKRSLAASMMHDVGTSEKYRRLG